MINEPRQYQPGDEKEIVNLLELVFNGWPKFDLDCTPLDHWIWKYIDNPIKMNCVTIAEYDDQLIGCDHSVYMNMYIQKKEMLCTHGTDTAVHPDHRGKRVYRSMNKYKRELRLNSNPPIDLGFWISGNKILIDSAIRRKRPHFKNPFLDHIFIRDIGKHFENKGSGDLVKKTYLYLQKMRRKSIDKDSLSFDGKIVDVNEFDGRIDDFIEKIRDNYNFIINRNQEYLNWRFCDIRGGRYFIKIAEKDSDIVGYIVLRINRIDTEYPVGFIVEMYSLDNDPRVLEALLYDAMEYFESEQVNIVRSFCISGSLEANLLKQSGFVSDRNEQHVFLNPISYKENIQELTNSSSNQISFNYGTSDWI